MEPTGHFLVIFMLSLFKERNFRRATYILFNGPGFKTMHYGASKELGKSRFAKNVQK